MEAGRAKAFGPRDAILSQVLRAVTEAPQAAQVGARMVNPLRVVVNQDASADGATAQKGSGDE